MTTPRARLLAAAALAALIACSPDPQPRGEEPPHLLYSADPQSLDNPFPDARLVTAGGLQFRPDWYRPFLMGDAITAKLHQFFNGYAEAARTLGGFGNYGPTLLRTSEPVDPASLRGVASRLRKTADGYEVLEADVVVEHSTDALAGSGVAPTADYPEFLLVRPSVPIPGGEEGLLVIRRGIRTRSGVELGRGFAFEDEPGARERIAQAATALGIPEDDVLLVLPFQAPDVLSPMQALAAWTTNAPPPSWNIPPRGTVPDGSTTRLVGRWTDADAGWNTLLPWLTRWSWANPASDVGSVTIGTFKARDLREDGLWRENWMADPSGAPEKDLWFVLVLPKGDRPAGGWPVVIGAHGLNGRNTLLSGNTNSFCMEVAQVLASRGLGCLGIDAPSHGTRGSSFDFFVIEDLRKTRDHFRQMAFDQMQLSRLATVIDVDADAVPDLAPEVGYFGNSLGGIMGGNFMSLDPRVRYGVLNVGGGGLANILGGKVIRDQIGLLLVARTGMTFGSPAYYSAFPLFRTVGQLFLEPGDPVNMGLAFRERPDVAAFLQMGVGDVTVPNAASRELASAMGLQTITSPVSGTTPVRALVPFDAQRYGKPDDYNGHNVFWDLQAARIQVLSFLGSSGTTLTVE